ncbi:MAG: RNA polymerase sigma factor [Rhodospirillales bacterium]
MDGTNERTGPAGADYEAIRRFVRRLVGDEALAQDLTQETFLRAQRVTTYHDAANRRGWLFSTALNLVRDHFRAAARRPVTISNEEVLEALPAESGDAEQHALQKEMSACIGEFLARLPPRQYEVVSLHDKAELNHTEIARALGISESNSRVLLHRGRVALRQMLEESCILSFNRDALPCERR